MVLVWCRLQPSHLSCNPLFYGIYCSRAGINWRSCGLWLCWWKENNIGNSDADKTAAPATKRTEESSDADKLWGRSSRKGRGRGTREVAGWKGPRDVSAYRNLLPSRAHTLSDNSDTINLYDTFCLECWDLQRNKATTLAVRASSPEENERWPLRHSIRVNGFVRSGFCGISC